MVYYEVLCECICVCFVCICFLVIVNLVVVVVDVMVFGYEIFEEILCGWVVCEVDVVVVVEGCFIGVCCDYE